METTALVDVLIMSLSLDPMCRRVSPLRIHFLLLLLLLAAMCFLPLLLLLLFLLPLLLTLPPPNLNSPLLYQSSPTLVLSHSHTG